VAYQSLYRKHRPQRFGELVGQDHVTTALRNAVRDGRVGHAYLFSGPRGTGKTTTARILAKALNCRNLGADGEPCGECEHCRAVAAGTFIDLFELDAASNRGVADTRELLERIAFRSATGGKKVYILDEVHMLTDAASNTLLKSLEEPPDHVVFVLATTNPEQVLPTIRSRTQHFEFTLLSAEQLTSHLAEVCAREGVDADPEALAVIARTAAGSVRDSLSLLDQALAHATDRLDVAEVADLFGGSPFETRARILQGIVDGDPAAVLVELSALVDAGHEPRRIADDLLRAARDAFLLHAGGGRVDVSGPEEERVVLQSLGAALGNTALVRIIETLGQAVVDMRGIDAADPRLVLEVALVRLARRDAGPPLALLAERVERLERALAAEGTPPGRGVQDVAQDAPRDTDTGVVPKSGAKLALGAVRSERAAIAGTVTAPSGAPPADPGSPSPSVPSAVTPPPSAVASAPLDLDEIVLAWPDILLQFPMATRSAVQHAQPIRVEGDVVIFGIAPQMLTAAQPRFRAAADTIREALKARFGRTLRFKLVASSEVDLTGGPDAASEASPARARPSGVGRPTASSQVRVEEPPAGDSPYDVALEELVDAEPARPAVSSIGILEVEFGATVVEERPRKDLEPS
jgi:DNA polymerase-3 subunit gamma/tau